MYNEKKNIPNRPAQTTEVLRVEGGANLCWTHDGSRTRISRIAISY